MRRFYVIAYQRIPNIKEPIEVRVHAEGPHIMDAVRRATQHLPHVYAVKVHALDGGEDNKGAA